MTISHAPYSIINGLVIVYGKTTKTACGKRVATSKLVMRKDTNCPACKAQIARDSQQAQEIIDAARETGYTGPDAHDIAEKWFI
jgi:hypothetical protein